VRASALFSSNFFTSKYFKIMSAQKKNIIVTTKHRGVWFAQVAADADLTPTTLTGLSGCRMAIKWGTSDGLHQLADTGPTNASKISAVADIEVLHDVTAVFSVTDQAAEIWLK
jgi:hypothetical protein